MALTLAQKEILKEIDKVSIETRKCMNNLQSLRKGSAGLEGKRCMMSTCELLDLVIDITKDLKRPVNLTRFLECEERRKRMINAQTALRNINRRIDTGYIELDKGWADALCYIGAYARLLWLSDEDLPYDNLRLEEQLSNNTSLS